MTTALKISNYPNEDWAFDLLKVGSWEYCPTQQILAWSPQTYDIHNIPRDSEIDVEQAMAYYRESDRDVIRQSIQECIESGKDYDLQLAIVDSKGTEKVVRTMGRRVLKPNGSYCIEGIIQDITLLVKLEKRVENATKKAHEFSSLLDKTAIVAETNTRGIITHVNQKFCEISKFDEDELIGQNHNILNSGFHSREFFKNLWKTIGSGRDWRGKIKNKAKDGTYYWVDTLIHPVKNSKGQIRKYLSIRHDITQEKEQEEINLKNSRLLAIGEASAQIMHDVMNPLAVIQSTEYLLRQASTQEDPSKLINNIAEKIDENVERIKSIFNDMRSILVDELELTTVDLKDIINESVALVDPIREKANVTIENDVRSSFHIVGNRNLLMQVMTNLLKNSIEAIENLGEKWIQIEAIDIGKYTFIRVIDSGHGIPKEVQEHMFDSFFTTKRDKGGTGIGLGLCRKIIDLHGGELKINNNNKNTEIDVVFQNKLGSPNP
ncbi:sensor histidine kinase [Pseudobacteriovorax antillogorgiicola]|uniref:histidine kinase n=1 Tax=Pseudobacteriovorax antillogorgiicola TaxID=1513793 RepID=A0A1Y6BC85_9BACT|nr:PAS domain-containing sensor histidine kinase [Pseudobacteriovorax antillogorgiicola]TCS57488.1 PAS domain S-box-containing protein [Pseudobacteriovorax antillogorgiicola]SMF00488.1 PAS domain S-box-containing protein [Pseudobacteriovorax antillogorgiicola]